MRTMIVALVLAGAVAPVAAQMTPPPPAPPPGAPMPPPPPGAMGAMMLLRADANGDGIVTREEAIAQATAAFDRVDANHDARIDKDEIAAMRDRRREMRDARRGDMPPPPPQ